jgi:hypothetical protein
MPSPLRLFASSLLLAALGSSALALEDGPPVELNMILKSLQAMKEQQSTTMKAVRQRAMQDAAAAAGNPARAIELWEEAVRATQFQGVAKENAQYKEWREKDGEALKAKEAQNALRLYFNWLSLTLKRSDGATNKDLLGPISTHLREAIADQAAMEAFDENLKREQEALTAAAGAPRRPGAANPRDREKRNLDASVKKMHDQILLRPLATSVYAEWLRLGDIISDVAPPPQRRGQGGGGGGGQRGQGNQAAAAPAAGAAPATNWEGTPGNVDGIFNTILLPEYRAQKDPRVVEYYDYRLRHDAEAASRTKLTFEIDKFNQVVRPQLLWQRNAELAGIGLKNRAAAEMFALIKANPNHPSNAAWITELETLLVPPAPASVSTGSP